MSRYSLRDYIWDDLKDSKHEIEFEGRHFTLSGQYSRLSFHPRWCEAVGLVFNWQCEPHYKAPPTQLEFWFKKSWQENAVGRALLITDPLDVSSQLFVAVTCEHLHFIGEGQPDTPSALIKPLPLTANELWTISQAELTQLVTPDLENPDSPARYALRWHHLSWIEKEWTRLGWKCGSSEELKTLTRWLLLSDEEFQHSDANWQIQYLFEADGICKITRWISPRGSKRSRRFPATPRVQKLGMLFLQYNCAYLQIPKELPPLVSANHYAPEIGATICYDCEPSSRHEYLEACLNLRDWLRGKVPDDEIEELVQPPTL